MTTLQIKPAQASDYPAMVTLMARLNQQPETQCIHSGEGADRIHKQILAYEAINEIRLVLARQDEQVLGVFGCEYDEGLGRGWLWGPFDPTQRGEAFVAKMFAELLKILPPNVVQLDSFLHIANNIKVIVG